eukprot:6180391-Pleurochrysis_carterae.AAC.1
MKRCFNSIAPAAVKSLGGNFAVTHYDVAGSEQAWRCSSFSGSACIHRESSEANRSHISSLERLWHEAAAHCSCTVKTTMVFSRRERSLAAPRLALI